MNANEARKVTEEALYHQRIRRRESIMQAIKNRADCGGSTYTTENHMSFDYEDSQYFQSFGYKIILSSAYNQFSMNGVSPALIYVISW